MEQKGPKPAPLSRPAARVDAWTLLGLFYLAACAMGNLYAPQPLYNVISAEYGTSHAATGLVVTVSLAALAIAPILYGPLISRVPASRLLGGACLLLALSGPTLYFAPGYPALLGARLLQGLLFPAVFTGLMAYISSHFQGQELQRVMAFYIGSMTFGGFFGRVAAGALSSLLDWRTALLILTLAPLLALPALARMPDAPRAARRWHHYSEYLAAFRDPGVGSLLLLEMLAFSVFGALLNFLPFRMAEVGQGDSEFLVGLTYAGFLLGGLVSFNSRRLSALCGGPVRLLLCGLFLYFPMLLLMAAPSALVLFIALCITCMGQFAVHSNVPGLINRLTTLDRGMINGLFLTCYYAGGALGSWLPGYVYKAHGWNTCLALFAALILVAVGVTWRLRALPAIRN